MFKLRLFYNNPARYRLEDFFRINIPEYWYWSQVHWTPKQCHVIRIKGNVGSIGMIGIVTKTIYLYQFHIKKTLSNRFKYRKPQPCIYKVLKKYLNTGINLYYLILYGKDKMTHYWISLSSFGVNSFDVKGRTIWVNNTLFKKVYFSKEHQKITNSFFNRVWRKWRKMLFSSIDGFFLKKMNTIKA